jgi:hypothetical protein
MHPRLPEDQSVLGENAKLQSLLRSRWFKQNLFSLKKLRHLHLQQHLFKTQRLKSLQCLLR